MAGICPDNSTECLLRELIAKLDAQSGFNWDPLSFAITAAIGILAVLVATMTVFQSLLSAGPGRFKASKAAIGPYSARTKTRFDWSELRYRTTTEVPFIDLAMYSLMSIGGEQMSAEIKSYPARWVTMMQTAALDLRYCRSISVVTDHLPADIAAAPAWATNSDGAVTYSFLTFDASGFFRMNLGYKFWMCHVRPDMIIRCNDCTHPVCHALIRVDIKNFMESYNFGHWLGPMMCRSPISPRAADLSERLDGLLSITRRLIKHCLPEQSPFGALEMYCQRGITSEHYRNVISRPHEKYGRGWSWLQSIPDEGDSGFNDKHYRRPQHGLRPPGRSNFELGAGDNLIIRPIVLHIAAQIRDKDWPQKLYSKASSSELPSRRELRGHLEFQLQEVDWWLLRHGGSLAACEALSIAVDATEKEHPGSKLELLGAHADASNVDRELSTNRVIDPPLSSQIAEGNDVRPRESPSLPVASAPIAPTSESTSGPPESTPAPEMNPEVTPPSPTATEEERRKELRAILIFRAAILTAYIYTAADISCVLEGELGDRIVQLL